MAYGSVDDDDVGGTGNDAVANKDDEYAVTPRCRYDDDGPGAGNEWRGAWRHTDPRERPIDEDDEGGVGATTGKYMFELSRSLKTSSADTDAQFDRGGTVDFGFAFWVSANRAGGGRPRAFPIFFFSSSFRNILRGENRFPPSDALPNDRADVPMPRLTNRPFVNTRTRLAPPTGSLRNERGRLDRWRALRLRLLEGLDLPPPRRRERRDLSGGRCRC